MIKLPVGLQALVGIIGRKICKLSFANFPMQWWLFSCSRNMDIYEKIEVRELKHLKSRCSFLLISS